MKKVTYFEHKVKNLITINKIVTIHYFEFSKDYFFGGEKHNFWEFVYVDKGEVTCVRNNEKIQLKTHQMLFHKPNEFHDVISNGKIAPNLFVMSFLCNSNAMKFFENKIIYKTKALIPFLSIIISEANKTFDMKKSTPSAKTIEFNNNPILGGEQMIKTALEQMLITAIRSESGSDSKIFISKNTISTHIVNDIEKYIDDNLYNIISLDKISECFNYGKTFLCTEFKNITGKSIMQYVNIKKLDKAKQLLRETDMNSKELSEKLNYDTPAYFSMKFKKQFNMTVTEYKKSILFNNS